MKKITYIIPLHTFTDDIVPFYKKAIESLNKLEGNEENKVILVGPKEVISKAQSTCIINIETILVESEDTDVFKQINKAAYQCITPYFSVLEFDDEYTSNWANVARKYGKNEASVLIPINELHKDGELVSLGNEIAWSSSFANTEGEGKGLGYLDIDCLMAYMDFNVTGALIKTEDFISLGGLKPSLKIAAWYEFLLRAAYNSKFIYVVPKIGYKHTIGRKGSYSEEISKEISQEYGKWLITTARQEYFFKNDREIKFTSKADN